MTKKFNYEINLPYLPRFTVQNAENIQKSAERSARVRKELDSQLGVPYGDTPGQKLDIFSTGNPGAPVHVFVHGGYWRSLDKSVIATSASLLSLLARR